MLPSLHCTLVVRAGHSTWVGAESNVSLKLTPLLLLKSPPRAQPFRMPAAPSLGSAPVREYVPEEGVPIVAS